MKRGMTGLLALAIAAAAVSPAAAQSLRYRIERVFSETLELQLAGSPGAHANHFNPANVETSQRMIGALSSFVGANVSTFPLTSTTASVAFDLSTGVPVRETSSLGPIYTERSKTLGRGRVILGYSFTYSRLSKIRGTDLSDLRFTFTHEDVGDPGMGDSPNELDTIDLFMNMEVDASILALYSSYGVTDKIDVSLAVPFVNVRVEADPVARINSFTLLSADSANHFFDGTSAEPVLESFPTPLNDDATGIGDVAVQAKYKVASTESVDLALLGSARLPTGDEQNFLGSGDPAYRVALVASGTMSSGAPHLNLAYEFRTADVDKDEIDVFVGYDQKVNDKATLSVDFMGQFEVGKDIEELDFAETVEIRRATGATTFERTVDLTNLPKFRDDHIVNGALGVKFLPRDFLLIIANVLVPLNDGGLRADVTSTLGVEFNF